MIINGIYETQNLLSLYHVSFLVRLTTYQHSCISVVFLYRGVCFYNRYLFLCKEVSEYLRKVALCFSMMITMKLFCGWTPLDHIIIDKRRTHTSPCRSAWGRRRALGIIMKPLVRHFKELNLNSVAWTLNSKVDESGNFLFLFFWCTSPYASAICLLTRCTADACDIVGIVNFPPFIRCVHKTGCRSRDKGKEQV